MEAIYSSVGQPEIQYTAFFRGENNTIHETVCFFLLQE